MSHLNRLEVLRDIEVGEHITLYDTVQPVSNADGSGKLYKKNNDDGLFWKPDANGVEIDLTQSSGTGSSIFGSEFKYVSDETTTLNTTNNFVTKLTLNTGNIPSGVYRIGWYYIWREEEKTSIECEIRVNGEVIHSHIEEPHERKELQKIPVSGYCIKNLTSTTHTVILRFRSIDAGDSYISNSRIEFWRIS